MNISNVEYYSAAFRYNGNPSTKARYVSLKLRNLFSMHHSIQIVFILLLVTNHLYCKAIVLGDLYKGVASYSHYNDVIMITIASQITSLAVVYSTVYSDADQRKHQSSASLAFVWGIHRDRTKGQLRGKCFHLMTSSWFTFELIFGELDLASSDKSNTWECCA